MQQQLWHAMSTEQLFETLQSTPQGLDAAEALRRLKRDGPNRLAPPRPQSLLKRFALQFHNLLIYVLLAAGSATALMEHWIDAGVIFGVVLINALIGVIQEGKAEEALAAISRMLSLHAMVQRNGAWATHDAESLIKGDLVMLQAGDRVPADLRLISLKELRIDEALLTGESLATSKSLEILPESTPLSDRTNMAFSGTLVTYGSGIGMVVATAEGSEIGKIGAMLRSVETLTTPLLRQIADFSRWLTGAILLLAALTFAIGVLLRGYTPMDMFLAAVGLAVAAIPEGLPAVMTITLAIGVQRMAARRAIIRRLPAVETLGSLSIICSDKTGTLTKNEMTLHSIITANRQVNVSGSGYDPHGSFSDSSGIIDIDADTTLVDTLRAGVLCNDAAVHLQEEQWRLSGDPTEGALIVAGMKCGLDPHRESERFVRSDVIPFDSEHGWMATLHHDHNGHGIIYLKGIPERLLELCATQYCDGKTVPIDTEFWQEAMHALASRGERVLALASRFVDPALTQLRFESVHEGLSLLGIVGLIDPPRDEAITAVGACQAAGIQVKMITGDHKVTAMAIARTLGISNGIRALVGNEIMQMDDAALEAVVESTDVFARTNPAQKLRIVTALQRRGHVVGMTGDGVNDAPALKRADVGIAMGQKGTEVSKQAAEVVLTDDNFATIVHAVEEGRTVYDNLKKSILFILPTNGGEALTILAAIAMGRMLPITPAQILWINMITAVTLALTLAFEPPEGHVMRRPPRPMNEPLLSPLLLWRITFVSIIMMVGTFGLFIWFRNHGSSLEEARTIALNTLVFFEIFYLFNTRRFTASSLQKIFENHYALYAVAILSGFQLLLTYAPPLQLLFETRPLDFSTWCIIIAVASSVFFLIETEKWLLRRREHKVTPS